MSLPPIGMLDGKLEDTDPCKNYKRAKAWHAKKKTECSGRETTLECQKALDAANVDEIQRGQAAKGCSGGRRRRKTRRSRRRKTRGGVETNPKGSPNGFGASGTAALAALAGRSAQQRALASTSGITGLPRVTEDPNENADSTSTRRKKEQRESVSGLFEKKGARRITRRR